MVSSSSAISSVWYTRRRYLLMCYYYYYYCFRILFALTCASTYAPRARTYVPATNCAKMWNRKQQSFYIIMYISVRHWVCGEEPCKSVPYKNIFHFKYSRFSGRIVIANRHTTPRLQTPLWQATWNAPWFSFGAFRRHLSSQFGLECM